MIELDMQTVAGDAGTPLVVGPVKAASASDRLTLVVAVDQRSRAIVGWFLHPADAAPTAV